MNRRHIVPPPSPPGCADDLPGWSEGLTRWLIQHAARNAPPALSERLEEEWLADLAERSGALARLRFGMGCCWATRVIAYEYSVPKVLAAASTTGNKVMNAYAQADYSLFSRRTLAFVLIVGLHGIFIYALANGLVHTAIQVIPHRIQAIVLPNIQRPIDRPPPIPQPTLSAPVVRIPPTEYPPEFPPENLPTEREVGAELGGQGAVPPATPVHSVTRVLGGPGKAFPNTNDFYPARAIRNGEKGVVTVNACVDDKGRLTAAPTVAKTSGTASLDDGALQLAKAGSGHYRPTTEDGRPVSSCYEFLVRYQIND